MIDGDVLSKPMQCGRESTSEVGVTPAFAAGPQRRWVFDRPTQPWRTLCHHWAKALPPIPSADQTGRVWGHRCVGIGEPEWCWPTAVPPHRHCGYDAQLAKLHIRAHDQAAADQPWHRSTGHTVGVGKRQALQPRSAVSVARRHNRALVANQNGRDSTNARLVEFGKEWRQPPGADFVASPQSNHYLGAGLGIAKPHICALGLGQSGDLMTPMRRTGVQMRIDDHDPASRRLGRVLDQASQRAT